MTTKNTQDVVAERVEEFRSVSQRKVGEGYIGDMPYTDYEYYFTQEQIDWLTTTLTQLVKEVEAGERDMAIHSTLQEIMDDVSVLHQRKELDDNGFCTIRDLLHSKALTPPTSDVIEK